MKLKREKGQVLIINSEKNKHQVSSTLRHNTLVQNDTLWLPGKIGVTDERQINIMSKLQYKFSCYFLSAHMSRTDYADCAILGHCFEVIGHFGATHNYVYIFGTINGRFSFI